MRPRCLGAAIDDQLAARALPALRAFGSNAVDIDLLTHLPFLARLERLHLAGVRMTRAQAIGLFARTPQLRALSLQTHDDDASISSPPASSSRSSISSRIASSPRSPAVPPRPRSNASCCTAEPPTT